MNPLLDDEQEQKLNPVKPERKNNNNVLQTMIKQAELQKKLDESMSSDIEDF